MVILQKFKDEEPVYNGRVEGKRLHKGFILLNCDLGAEEYIVDELKQMSIISNAYLTFGAYDVIAEIETENQDRI